MPGETDFQSWYAGWSKKLGLNPNPDDPQHFYDYRAAFQAGAVPDKSGHWPSQFKREGHPRMVVGGVNTKTGNPVAQVPRIKPGVSTNNVHPRGVYFLESLMEVNGGPVTLSEGNRQGREVPGGAVNTKHNTGDDGWVRAMDISLDGLNRPKEEIIEAMRAKFPGWGIDFHTKGTAPHLHVEIPPPTTRARQAQKAYDQGQMDKENPAVQQLLLRGLIVDRTNPMQSLNGRRALNMQADLDAGKLDANNPAVKELARRGYLKLNNDPNLQNAQQPSPVGSADAPSPAPATAGSSGAGPGDVLGAASSQLGLAR